MLLDFDTRPGTCSAKVSTRGLPRELSSLAVAVDLSRIHRTYYVLAKVVQRLTQ